MRDNAKLLLGIMRDANRQNIALDQRVFDIICKNLGVDNQDLVEITAWLEADLLDRIGMKPEFEDIKVLIRKP